MKAKDFDREEFLTKTWPEALESGEFEQGEGTLKEGGKYCCLGVACELLSREKLLPRKAWSGFFTLPDRAMYLLGIGTNTGDYGNSDRSLATDNDSGKSFLWIANKIRRVVKSKRAGFV